MIELGGCDRYGVEERAATRRALALLAVSRPTPGGSRGGGRMSRLKRIIGRHFYAKVQNDDLSTEITFILGGFDLELTLWKS